MVRKKREPEQISEILKRVVPSSSSTNKLEKARNKWRLEVGEELSARTRVIKFAYGTLYIGVASSPLLSELNFLKDELLERLRYGDNAVPVSKIVFSLKEV